MNRGLANYLVAVALVSLGMYIHVLLFNLYLADLGFREDTMGRLVGAMTLGTALGTVAAAALARRAGLRLTILVALCGLSLALAWRAVASATSLTAASFLAGFFLAGWFVTNAPAIAALSFSTAAPDARQSALPFSFNTALGIGVGAAGGFLAGWLPGWLPGASAAATKRMALLAAAALPAVATLVIVRLRFPEIPHSALRIPHSFLLRSSPSRAFLLRFLAAVSVWYVFSAGFLPFFNVYLRNRMGASLETIGGIFAATQVAQALAVLLMAPLIAWLRPVRAVVLTQLLAAAALFALWPVETLHAAAALCLVYLSFQVMSEPGLQSMLMSRMQPEERATASAANLLLMFGMQALAGAAAGALIAARGYSALFIALGATGLIAAALFGGLFARAFPAEIAPAASDAGSSPARRE